MEERRQKKRENGGRRRKRNKGIKMKVEKEKRGRERDEERKKGKVSTQTWNNRKWKRIQAEKLQILQCTYGLRKHEGLKTPCKGQEEMFESLSSLGKLKLN